MSDPNYINEIRQVWELVKESFLESQSETAVNLWLGDIEILSFDGELILLGINGELKFKIVQERYMDQIRQKFCHFLGFDVTVKLSFAGDVEIIDLTNVKRPKPDEDRVLPNYNFEYTFENFIVGNTNKFAHAACVAVANRPATNYNPLFIYGNSGLGKTHLMSAIVNRMKQNNPNVKIIYTKGEDFTNQMIACLADKTMDEFRDKFRKCDVLLIDDIQFIAGKMAIQEEFFHTFNTLFEEKKQIILTSDRPPRDIKLLEDRLKTRFEWGLLADIEPPDLELRIAIIKNKAEQVNVSMSDEVLNYLGENLRSNVRQIEGAIKKLGALSFLSGRSITMDVARSCISELLGGAEPVNVTVDKIFAAVYRKYGVSRDDITGSKRNKEIAIARHVSIYLIREITEMSFPNISKIYSRDHSTILSSVNTVKKRLETDPAFVNEIADLKKDVIG